jgi:PEP-CTERM motif
VTNPANGAFSGDRDDLNWIVLTNLNAIPNPANGDEFIPTVTKNDYLFGVTEGNANNINPPGILPGEYDVFFLNFSGVSDLTSLDLSDFVQLTGIRLQSLPDNINGGSLFLAGVLDDPGTPGPAPVPEPTTLLLIGVGLAGMAGMSRRKSKKA